MRLIVAGGKDFNDYPLLERTLDELLADRQDKVYLVNNNSRGASELALSYARKKGYGMQYCHPDFKYHKHKAHLVNNKKMASISTFCVVFFDGKDEATTNLIEEVKAQHKTVRVIRYKPNPPSQG